MKRAKKNHGRDEHLGPSQVALAALLATGAGKHQESKVSRSRRTGRLQGAEKRRVMSNHDD